MKRMILAGALALVSGVTGLMAQQKQPQPKSPKEVEALQPCSAPRIRCAN